MEEQTNLSECIFFFPPYVFPYSIQNLVEFLFFMSVTVFMIISNEFHLQPHTAQGSKLDATLQAGLSFSY